MGPRGADFDLSVPSRTSRLRASRLIGISHISARSVPNLNKTGNFIHVLTADHMVMQPRPCTSREVRTPQSGTLMRNLGRWPRVYVDREWLVLSSRFTFDHL